MTENITIGTVGYPITKNQLMPHVDVIEMTEARHIPPGKKAAKHLKNDLTGNVQCTVQMSRYFWSAPAAGITLKGDLSAYGNFQTTDESLKLWKRQLDFATEMNARALVMITPSAVTPSAANVKAMSTFLNTIDRGNIPIVWEAHGPWGSGQVQQFAKEHNVIPAIDPLRDEIPEGDIAYFRFGAFAATGSRMGVYELEQIVAHALECRANGVKEVFCLFDTHRALDDARNLKKVVEEFGADNFDEFDYDDDDDHENDDDF